MPLSLSIRHDYNILKPKLGKTNQLAFPLNSNNISMKLLNSLLGEKMFLNVIVFIAVL